MREQQITRLVCDGRGNQEIADEVGLSLAMVKKHLHAVFRKLEVTSPPAAIRRSALCW